MSERARQFLPFDALKGYKEAIIEKQRIIVDKKELSEDDQIELSNKLNQVKVGMMIKVVYYDKDNYVLLEGLVSKINISEKYLMIVKTKIPFEDIHNLNSKEFSSFD